MYNPIQFHHFASDPAMHRLHFYSNHPLLYLSSSPNAIPALYPPRSNKPQHPAHPQKSHH